MTLLGLQTVSRHSTVFDVKILLNSSLYNILQYIQYDNALNINIVF